MSVGCAIAKITRLAQGRKPAESFGFYCVSLLRGRRRRLACALDCAGISDARSNRNLLNLVERDFVRTPVVELSGARRGVVGERLGVLQRALVLEVTLISRGSDSAQGRPGAATGMLSAIDADVRIM
jgi:hypothetical protein